MTVQGEIITARSEEWAKRILSEVAHNAEAVIRVGQRITECQLELPHGEFLAAVKLTGMSPRDAQRYMAVAANTFLSNATHVSHLPSAYSTLYQLSRLDAPALEGAVARGAVCPTMTREQARRLVDPDGVPDRKPKEDDPEHGRWVCPLCHGKGWVDKEPREGFGRYSRKSELAS